MKSMTELRAEVLRLEQAIRDGGYACCDVHDLQEGLIEARAALAQAEAEAESARMPAE